MVVWTIPSLGVSQLRLIWSTGSMQVFPWEQDRGVRPAFPLPDKTIHTHIHTLMCTHMPATIWLELASCPLWRVEPITRWHPSVRKSFSEGGSERKFKARWQETVTDSLFFSSGHNPNPIHTHTPLIPPNLLWLFSETKSDRKVRWAKFVTLNNALIYSLKSSPVLNLFFLNVVSLHVLNAKWILNAFHGQTEIKGSVSTASASPIKQLTAVCLMLKALKVCTCVTVRYWKSSRMLKASLPAIAEAKLETEWKEWVWSCFL